MTRYRIEHHNLDGRGSRPVRVFALAPATEPIYSQAGHIVGQHPTYWPAVTDVPCPVCETGTIRWAEAGYVPGYRICDGCGRHFQADGNKEHPTLIRFGQRRDRKEVSEDNAPIGWRPGDSDLPATRAFGDRRGSQVFVRIDTNPKGSLRRGFSRPWGESDAKHEGLSGYEGYDVGDESSLEKLWEYFAERGGFPENSKVVWFEGHARGSGPDLEDLFKPKRILRVDSAADVFDSDGNINPDFISNADPVSNPQPPARWEPIR